MEKYNSCWNMSGPDDYWQTYTVAEFLLINRGYKEASEMYAEAFKLIPKSYGNYESSFEIDGKAASTRK